MKRINHETYIKKHFKYDNGTLIRDVPHLINLKNVKPVINKVTKCQYVYYDTCTKGLKAKYRVKVPNKRSASFRTLSEAKEFLNKEGVQYECL